jgi:hypothetical protein
MLAEGALKPMIIRTAEDASGHLRSVNAAAPLKRDEAAAGGALRGHLRSVNAAAPLKQ